MVRLTTIGITLISLWALGSGGCKSAKEEAKTFKRCGQGRRCKSPNVCIRTGSRGDGVCIYPCKQDADCPKPFRCTGGFKLSGKSGRFCRRPSVDEGGACTRVQDGCKVGLRCFKDHCVRECSSDKGCPIKTTRCLKVVDTTRDGKTGSQKGLYKGCVEAKQKHGQPCSRVGPFCAQEHICYRGKCLHTCARDKGCPKGFICDGAFWTGTDAKRKQARGTKPDIRYCRSAGGKNAACDLRRDKPCARGLSCLGNRCRTVTRVALGKPCHERRGILCAKGATCYAGRCRQQCKVHENCPKVHHKAGRCLARTVGKKKIGLCF